MVGRSGYERQVSLTYGSGGAKRQRTIESAVIVSGLPETLVHAGIKRPIYGLRLAENLEAVVWAGQQPSWVVDRHAGCDQHDEAVTRDWRQRWLPQAQRRLSHEGVQFGVFDWLEHGREESD